jgi:hypothetical protein
VILAEFGPDMSRFPTDRHATSWTAICPGNHESAGKCKSGRPRNGNPHLQAALVESANAAIRTRDTYLRAQYEQVRCRRGQNRAIVVVAHSILIARYHILKDDVPSRPRRRPLRAPYRPRTNRQAARRAARTARPHRHVSNVNGTERDRGLTGIM